MMLPILETTTNVGYLFEHVGFGLFGSVEVFGLIVIIAFALFLGIIKLPPRLIMVFSGFIVIAFKFIYGGVVFNTLTAIVILIYGYLLTTLITNVFSGR